MKFFKSLLANHSFSTTDFSTESNHTQTIDHAAEAAHAAQTAMSSALASYVQATAAISSPTFDARPVGASEPVHVIAPTAPQALDFHSFTRAILTSVAPAVHVTPVAPVVTHAIEVDKTAALDAAPAQIVEWAHTALADAAHSADAIAAVHQIAAVHTVDATRTADVIGHSPVKVEAVTAAAQIDTFEFVIQAVPTNNAVPMTMEFHDKHDLFAPMKSDLEPAPESVRVAEIVHGPDLKIDSDVSPEPIDSVSIPKPADGADRWENHSMFSVKPPESEGSSEGTWEKGIVAPVDATHHWTDTFWEDGSWVADSLDSRRSDQPVGSEALYDTQRPGSVVAGDQFAVVSTLESSNDSDASGQAIAAPHRVDLTDILPIAVDTTPVAPSVAHGVIGTVIVGDAGSSNSELVAGCSPSSFESWIPHEPVVFQVDVEKPGRATTDDTSNVASVEPTTAIAAPEVTSLPEVADGADRWENHSMFSVGGPSEGTVAAEDTEAAKTAKIDATEATTTVDDARVAVDAVQTDTVGVILQPAVDIPSIPVASPFQHMNAFDFFEPSYPVARPDPVQSSQIVKGLDSKIDTTEATTTVEGKDARQAQDLVSDSTETWSCNLPVSTEELRNHPIAEFTLPLRSSESSASQVLDATTYDVVAAVYPSFVGMEQHAVI